MPQVKFNFPVTVLLHSQGLPANREFICSQDIVHEEVERVTVHSFAATECRRGNHNSQHVTRSTVMYFIDTSVFHFSGQW